MNKKTNMIRSLFKSLIICFIFSFSARTINAQNLYNGSRHLQAYLQSYLQSNLTDSIHLSAHANAIGIKNTEKYIYIDVVANGVGLEIAGSYENAFKISLLCALNTYMEWDSICIKNNVKYIRKKIPVKFYDVNCFFKKDGKWCYEHGLDIWAVFIRDSTNSYLLIESDYMSQDEEVGYSTNLGPFGNAAGNDYVHLKSDGVTIVFSSANEMLSFISKYEKALIKKKEDKNKSKLLK